MIRRVAARVIDVGLALLLGFIFALGPVGTLFARRAVVMLRIGEPGTLWKGPIPMLMGIAGTFVYALPLAFLLVALAAPAVGASPGELLLRVRPRGVENRAARWRQAIVLATPWWGLTAALLIGSWQFAVVVLGATALAALFRTARMLGRTWSARQPRG